MARVAITGGGGFLGAQLARRLVEAGSIALDGQAPEALDELLLIDRVTPPEDLAASPNVRVLVGDLASLLAGRDDPLAAVDAVFHLAAAVSGECERDFDLGMAANLDTSRAVFEAARHQSRPPVVVFSSSVAVFGLTSPTDADGNVVVIDDDTLPTPLNSYGIQKFVCEQLLADYTRRGFVRGRSVRLMTVTVRPGKPNAAASSFVSGIVREPLAGERAVCPVPLDTELAVSSPRTSIDGLLRAASACAAEWGSRTALNLPPITLTPRDLLDAMDRVAADRGIASRPSDLVDVVPDPAIADVVLSWPARFRPVRAASLGLYPETSADAIVAAYAAGVFGPEPGESPR